MTTSVVRWVLESVVFAVWLTLHFRLAWRAALGSVGIRAWGERLLGLVVPGVAVWRAWQQNSRTSCAVYGLLVALYLIALLA